MVEPALARALAAKARWLALLLAVALGAVPDLSGEEPPVPARSAKPPADWPAFRGDLRRSGSTGNASGPSSPALLWTLPGKNHYFAAAAPGDETIFLAALGAFNTPVAMALASKPGSEKRVLWSRGPPALLLPPVASPVLVGGIVVFGEGMHQNAGGALSAFVAADGLPLWRLDLPGELRHVEGSPAFSAGRFYFGCGSGGVLCVEGGRVRLEGEDLSTTQAEARIRRRWKELLEAYAKEKESDPDFAVPPDESKLPTGSVEIVWAAGAERWHVDSPLAVSGERVLVGSAYLDDEKIGDRALLCLSSQDGGLHWRTPLSFNPWGSPSVAAPEAGGGRALVLAGCSSIRFDPARIEGAMGEVVAAELESGKIVWRLSVPGGVLSPVSIDRSGEVGVFTATDGAVRAVRTSSGDVIWTNAGKTPYLAGVALASDRVFTSDLDGVVRALALASGKELWRLSLAAHPRVGLPGRVFAPPLCDGDRLYLATANIDGPHAGSPTVVACIGEKGEDQPLAEGITMDAERRRVIVDAKIAPRKLPHLDAIYPIEVIVTAPEGKKAHETVLTTGVQPSALDRALRSLGASPGKPGLGEQAGEGPEVRLRIEFPGAAGRGKRIDVGQALIDRKTGLPLGGGVRWRFTGSSLARPDPAAEEATYGADFSGTLVTVYPVTSETVLQSSLGMEAEALLELEVAPCLPPPGTPVRLVIEIGEPQPSSPEEAK